MSGTRSDTPGFWDLRYRTACTPWIGTDMPEGAEVLRDALPRGARILIPGCGNATEVAWLARQGFDVDAVDFSEAAVERARRDLGEWGSRVRQADFFSLMPDGYDAVIERAFLCALPPERRQDYMDVMARLLAPGGLLCGWFYLSATRRGPPFGLPADAQQALFAGVFTLERSTLVRSAVPVFDGEEYLQLWRRN